MAVTPQVVQDADFDGVEDFSPAAQVWTAPLFVVVALPVNTLSEFIADARKNSVSFASAAIGSFGPLASELLANQAALTMTHVPYKGMAHDERRDRRRSPAADHDGVLGDERLHRQQAPARDGFVKCGDPQLPWGHGARISRAVGRIGRRGGIEPGAWALYSAPHGRRAWAAGAACARARRATRARRAALEGWAVNEFEQLLGRFFRLKKELAATCGARPLNRREFDRALEIETNLARTTGQTELDIAALQPRHAPSGDAVRG